MLGCIASLFSSSASRVVFGIPLNRMSFAISDSSCSVVVPWPSSRLMACTYLANWSFYRLSRLWFFMILSYSAAKFCSTGSWLLWPLDPILMFLPSAGPFFVGFPSAYLLFGGWLSIDFEGRGWMDMTVCVVSGWASFLPDSFFFGCLDIFGDRLLIPLNA